MSVTKEFAVKIDTELSSWHDKRWTVTSKILDAEDSIEFNTVVSNLCGYRDSIRNIISATGI